MTIAAVALTVCSCGGGGNKSDGEQIPEKKVMSVKLDTCDVPFSFPAQLKGKQDINIVPEVNGILTEVLVSEGQKVRKGQPMFKVDATAYEAATDNARALMEMAEAEVQTQELELAAVKKLFESGVVSEHRYKVQMNALQVAKARLAEAKAALKKADDDLRHTVVRSPHDGVVGNIHYRQGSLVSPGIDKPLTVVSDNSTVYAYISLNADEYLYMASLEGGREKLLESLPEMELILGDDTIYSRRGRVETISGMIDELTGSVSVRVAFPNPDGMLASGGSGVVRMYYKYEGMVIPRSATYEIQDKVFAYKVQGSDTLFTAKSAMVEVYRLNESEYIVTDGLESGDRIVLDGVKKMSDKMRIIPKEQ